MKILALDTATEGCSAALWIDELVGEREVEAERGHAELILTMVDEVLSEAGVPLSSLDAIAFGRGPGAFTGVRLAASVAQGLAFGAGLPVVPISDLQAVAQRVFDLRTGGLKRAERPPAGQRPAELQPVAPLTTLTPNRVLVCNDARMHEVYWACFELGDNRLMRIEGTEHVSPPAQVALPASWIGQQVLGAGRGFRVYPILQEKLSNLVPDVMNDVLPCASAIASLAAEEVRSGRVLPAEEALPVYLRDDVAQPKPT